MSRFIRPYVQLSHLNHRFGQRCGWAPNCINASGAGGGGAFNPDSIPSIIQNLGTLTYADSPLGTIPVLESSIGEVGTPRGQSCVQFDGSNDYLASASAAFRINGEMTASAWINPTANTGSQAIACCTNGSSVYFIFGYNGGRLQIWQTGGGQTVQSSVLTLAGSWNHVAMTRSGSAGNWTLTIYLNGVSIASTTTATDSNGAGALGFAIGRCGDYAAWYYSGVMSDPRVYSVAKTASEILAIYNQHEHSDTVDTTNALGIWPLQEEAGTKCYDVSGNGNDLTATNVDTTPGAFRTTDSGVKYSFPNEFGYTNNAGVIIPADLENPTLDCEGDALETPGPIWLPGVMEVPCVTVTGTEYLALAHLTGSETVVSKVGTSTASIAAGRINLTAGTISSIALSDGTTLPLQEGPGSSNTNRTCHNVDSTGRHATLTNGSVASMWAARLNTVEDHCINFGGGIAANGAFVPGIPGSANDAAGNAKTLAVGKRKNPYSVLLRNYFSAPSLVNIGITSSDRLNQYKCVTGNGSDVYVDLGSTLISDDFDLTFDFYATSSPNIYSAPIIQSSNNSWTNAVGIYYAGGWRALCGAYAGVGDAAITSQPTTDAWNHIRFRKVGTTAYITVNSNAEQSFACSNLTAQRNTQLLRDGGGGYYNGSVANLTIGIKEFPLTDGSGSDLACFTDGVMSVISNAIKGTLTNVWANNTDGKFTVPYALQAAITRQTKFSGDDEKHVAFREALTGSELANVEEWVQ